MYIDIRGKAEDQYLETMTEDLIFDLSKILPGKLKVFEVASVRKLKETDMEIAHIAKNLGVQFVFESSLQRSGDGFNLRCKLVEAQTGTDKYINKWFIEENSLQQVVKARLTIIFKVLMNSLSNMIQIVRILFQ